MVDIAENSIRSNESIKKVIILEHPPRFDTKDKDPLSLKPEFAKYANNVYTQLWLASNLKDKIVLGKHNLDCNENVRLDRFTDRESKRYDGIHMYNGRNAYTESVLSVLTLNMSTDGPRPRTSPSYHSTCPQTKYMNAQKAKSNSQYSVPVQNRFTGLGN